MLLIPKETLQSLRDDAICQKYKEAIQDVLDIAVEEMEYRKIRRRERLKLKEWKR
jgi:hypothetical protein